MRIAVLGAGNIGGTLGAKWAEAGHEVVFGVRDPSSPKNQTAIKTSVKLTLDSIANAISFGDIVLFAIPGPAVDSLVKDQASALDRKIVIDATNNMSEASMSAIPAITARVPFAQVFRAFNNLGWENFAEPSFRGVQADLFYCGHDDERAREKVERLVRDTGLRPIYVGGLDQLQVVDNLTRLWFALAHGRKMGRHLAFKVLT